MRLHKTATSLLAAGVLACSAGLAQAEETQGSFEGAARDAWITGKIETVYTLNEHLNPFRIDTDVENGIVHLTGTVESQIDRDLAGELAKGISGVLEVENDLEVDAESAMQAANADGEGNDRRNFGSWVDDATTTAAVKTRLLRNASTKGLQIDVDTMDDVVTLSGSVETAEEKSLAEEIARNSSDVRDVRNNLVVDPA